MTKEELEKEVEEKAETYSEAFIEKGVAKASYAKGYLAGAEPREKQIQIDAEQIRALQKQNGELTDRVKELEAQIEKMKCCYNCAGYYTEQCTGCEDYSNWELRR